MRRYIVCFLVISFMGFTLNSFAGWDIFKELTPREKIPLPSGSIKISSEKSKISGEDFTTAVYTSDLSIQEIKNFYRKNLSLEGWQEMSLPNQENFPSQGGKGVEFISFIKENRIITVTFLTSSLFRGKTTFSLLEGKLPSPPPSESLSKSTKPINYMPLYPQAEQLFYSGGAWGANAAYNCSDDIYTVANFYKEKMPAYGWFLVEEKLPEEQKLDSSFLKDKEKCPSCAQHMEFLGDKLSNVKVMTSYLQFANENADSCTITISQISGVGKELTNIGVVYAKKK